MNSSRAAARKGSALPEVVDVSTRGAVRKAAEIVAKGGMVAFPTETVYGLAVRMNDPKACARLQRAKGRPGKKPFQIIVGGKRQAARLCPEMPASARRLARRFWPGPLTLVVKGANGRWTGIRLPDHHIARRLATLCGGAIVATSANVSGTPPAVTAQGAARSLKGRVDMVLDGGRAGLGHASTVVKCGRKELTILREGAIPAAQILKTACQRTR